MRFSLSESIARYRGVIFDLDGTLVQLPVDWPRVRIFLHRCLSPEDTSGVPMLGVRVALEEIERRMGPDALAQAFKTLSDIESEAVESLVPIKANVDLVRECERRGQHVAIFSANSRRAVLGCLSKLGLDPVCHPIVAGDDVQRRKPDPEGLCRILSTWRLDVSQVAYVADGESEAETAARLGLHLYQV